MGGCAVIVDTIKKVRIECYLVKKARVSRMPEVTLSFNASDDEVAILRSF